MGAMDEAATEENLGRAWRWIRTNPEAAYKSYFRPLYGSFAIADQRHLSDLRDRLRRGIYEPTLATKVFLPKASGILRPYSLLTVEDQIAYQAAVNVVAERLAPKVRGRYGKEVFGHLYAGKSSIWFYQKWSRGYAAFTRAARAAFKDGYRVAASFDLTACYDSLDHNVLCHFMGRLGLRPDFSKTLTSWLSQWTATDHGIYHNHGIPQGPLSSGLLAEVVLQHFDANRGREGRVRYLRYVDDIRLFAKSEFELRRMLIVLDRLSKDAGLFPQSSKISIHEVKDIESELKTVSSPVESVLKTKLVDQARLRKRLVALSPRFVLSNPTRFKFLLAHASPHHTLTTRLWRIYDKAPEVYANVCWYLAKYDTLPVEPAKRVLREIKHQNLYPAVAAAFIQAACSRLPASLLARGNRLIKELWKPRIMQPDVVVAAGRWAFENNLLTDAQLEYACTRPKAWWVRARLIQYLKPTLPVPTVFTTVVNKGLRNPISDSAIAAASQAEQLGCPISTPRRGLNRHASETLKELGLIRRGTPKLCGIEQSLIRMVGSVDAVSWRKFFGKHYRTAERQIVNCRARLETDLTAWVNGMDVFNDWLLKALYRMDKSLGTYGGFAVLGKHGALFKTYPDVHEFVESVHAQRYASELSHPLVRKTGKATGPIRYSYLKTAKPLLRRAVAELALAY